MNTNKQTPTSKYQWVNTNQSPKNHPFPATKLERIMQRMEAEVDRIKLSIVLGAVGCF